MLAILGLVFPLIKSFLGENMIEKLLAHKHALAASANERERAELDADVKILGYELERRKATYGLASACIGGGQGIAMIIKREA